MPRRSPQPDAVTDRIPRMENLPWRWVIAVGLGCIVGIGITVITWLWLVAGSDARLRMDAVRTGFTVAFGAGGLATLALFARRQWLQERGQVHEELDATERRVTDMYVQAVEQLGHDKPAVRMGGLYALERLGRNHSHYRQVVVNVICAYLRTPMPSDEDEATGEFTVRKAAQDVLANRLRDPRPREQRDDRFPEANVGYWGNVTVNLNNATLHGAQFNDCVFHNVDFSNTTFLGDTSFVDARFFGPYLMFDGARFESNAGFTDARFHSFTHLSRVRFAKDATFRQAEFRDGADVRKTRFHGSTSFKQTECAGPMDFSRAEFGGKTRFSGTIFSDVTFGRTTFAEVSDFRWTRFRGAVRFRNAVFAREAIFSNLELEHEAWFDGAEFQRTAAFPSTVFASVAAFGGTRFGGPTIFKGARFLDAVGFGGAEFTGPARFDGASLADSAGFTAVVAGERKTTKRSPVRVSNLDIGHVWPDGWEIGDDASLRHRPG